jgi:hydroxyethylthiazole kinase-like uncharacterized protein yjeF
MHPLPRVPELRALERAAAANLPPGELMLRAGRAAAKAAGGLLAGGAGTPAIPAGVLVLCGPGDNGGDGFTCATALRGAGVSCACWAPEPGRSDDATRARAAWLAAGGEIVDSRAFEQPWDLVVDAVFGIGLSRPPGPPWSKALAWAASQAAPILALDVPSGLDADTGLWVGGAAGAAATLTVTFLADKPGLHGGAGPDAAGRILVACLDVPQAGSAGCLLEPADFPQVLRARQRDAHKGTSGSVCVVGGARGTTGAALLAARAALRMGAGRVYVDLVGTPSGPRIDCDPQQPELMFRAAGEVPEGAVFITGCGLGQDGNAREAVAQSLARTATLVLDADAINLLAADGGLAAALRARPALTVLTPHPLEAARLLGRSLAGVQADRIGAALEIAGKFGAHVVLKGAGSIIASPEGRWALNPTGSPALATAGSGDVLSGMIGALVAQGCEFGEAVAAAVWLHGRAGELHGGDVGLVAGEIAKIAVGELVRLRAA